MNTWRVLDPNLQVCNLEWIPHTQAGLLTAGHGCAGLPSIGLRSGTEFIPTTAPIVDGVAAPNSDEYDAAHLTTVVLTSHNFL